MMVLMKRLLAILVLSAAGLSAAACPMCKDSASNAEGASSGQLHDAYSSQGENISGGLNTSIYVMFACLLGVGGMVPTVMVMGMRSAGGAGGDDRSRE
jgi:hypothetical protein